MYLSAQNTYYNHCKGQSPKTTEVSMSNKLFYFLGNNSANRQKNSHFFKRVNFSGDQQVKILMLYIRMFDKYVYTLTKNKS